MPDSGCNPYLALAAVVAAGIDGIDRQLDPGEPTNLNMYEMSDAAAHEKKHRAAAAEPARSHGALDTDEVVKAGLGAELAAEFIKLKRMEWTEYARHVSDWETRRYLEFF